jgi:hypothetical protein
MRGYRNKLFWTKEEGETEENFQARVEGSKNPIGRLGVREEDVVFAYTLLRRVAETRDSTVQRHAKDNFKGTVLLDYYPKPTDDKKEEINLFTRPTIYGTVFGRLALFVESQLSAYHSPTKKINNVLQ